ALREGEFFDLMYVNHDNGNFDDHHNYAFLRKFKNELLLIAVNFNDWPTHIGIRIPQHAFDCWSICPGEYLCEELLGKEVGMKNITPDILFDTPIQAYGAVIWKCRIKPRRRDAKKSK
ncbi:MAG: alpha-amylase, partial [Porphyromonadaceae bacterium]|nr:alpha-amylase [Porphyromonadaceae bacterium]